MMFQNYSTVDDKWIGAVLDANPNAAKAKNYDRKTPLHLAYQYGVSTTIVDRISHAYSEAANVRDNLGRTPKELDNTQQKSKLTPAKEATILTDNSTNET